MTGGWVDGYMIKRRDKKKTTATIKRRDRKKLGVNRNALQAEAKHHCSKRKAKNNSDDDKKKG